MDYLLLGFMVSQYLKDIGFDGDTDTDRVRDVINAYIAGYANYIKDDEEQIVLCQLLIKKDNSIFVCLEKEK